MSGLATPAKLRSALPRLDGRNWDILARIPAVTFFGVFTLGYAHSVMDKLPGIAAMDAAGVLQLLARVAAFAFVLLVTIGMAARLPPLAKRGGVLPRLVALGGAFTLLALPLVSSPAEMPLGVAALSFSLLAAGHAFSCYALLHLGRALSIMAEARRLVTTGPYAVVRHPLYAAEALATFGILLQFWSAPAVALWAVHVCLQFGRMFYEEQVLRQTFPEYDAYAGRTSRLVPGVF